MLGVFIYASIVILNLSKHYVLVFTNGLGVPSSSSFFTCSSISLVSCLSSQSCMILFLFFSGIDALCTQMKFFISNLFFYILIFCRCYPIWLDSSY